MSAAYVRPRHVIRVNGPAEHPRSTYVRRIRLAGSDFSLTYDKTKARAFLPATAAAYARLLGTEANTFMTFDTCEAAA